MALNISYGAARRVSHRERIFADQRESTARHRPSAQSAEHRAARLQQQEQFDKQYNLQRRSASSMPA